MRTRVAKPPGAHSRIVVRRARMDDSGVLEDIARESFPDEVLWQVGRMARRYWQRVLASPSSETWLWHVDGDPAGFIQIVVDLPSWLEEKERLHYGLPTKLLALATHPRLVLLKVRKRIDRHRSGKVERDPDHEPPTSRVRSGASGSSGRPELVRYGGIHVEPGQVVWHELTAVSPRHRKLGLALRILRFGEERARQLGRHEVCGMARLVQEQWCWLLEQIGYVRTGGEDDRNTYTKVLDDGRIAIEEQG